MEVFLTTGRRVPCTKGKNPLQSHNIAVRVGNPLRNPDKALTTKIKLCQLQFSSVSALQNCSVQPTVNSLSDIQHGNMAPSGPADQSDTICFKCHHVI